MLLLLLLLLKPLPALAASDAFAWKPFCTTYKDLQPPEADRPKPEEAAALKGCDSESLYYGIGKPADPVQARKCALLEEKTNSSLFGGGNLLMVIYANGVGATRNYDLALHYACALGDNAAEAEMSSRIQGLKSRKDAASTAQDFTICQDTTSGFMMGICAAHEERISQVGLDNRVAKIAAKVPAANKASFEQLQKAAAAFIEARVANEVDLSGTARSMFMINEEHTLRQDYTEMLEAFDRGKSHRYTAAERDSKARALDDLLKRMNEVAAKAKDIWGTVTMDGIQKTEATWIGYKDAFTKYATERYPKVTEASVQAWLTAKRIHMLKSISGL